MRLDVASFSSDTFNLFYNIGIRSAISIFLPSWVLCIPTKAYLLSGAFDCLDVKEPLTGAPWRRHHPCKYKNCHPEYMYCGCAHLTPISIVYSLCAVYLQHLVVIGLEQKAWKKSSVQWAVPAAKWAFQACHVCRRSGFRGASFPGHIGKQHLVATGRGVYKGACWRSDIPDG